MFYRLTIDALVEVDLDKLTPEYDSQGNIYGFKLTEDLRIRPIVGLEIADVRTDTYFDLTSEKDLDRHGIDVIDYVDHYFVPQEEGE